MAIDPLTILKFAFFGVVMPLGAIYLARFLVKLVFRKIFSRIIGYLPVYVADRYLFSRSNRNAINIITFISVLGITYVTAALVLVLSIFNGFQVLIEDMYTAFDPDIKVVAARGKGFAASDSLVQAIKAVPGVAYVTPVVQDKAMLTYFDKQRMVEVRGVPQDYLRINRLDTLVYEGDYAFQTENGFPMIVLGGSVAYFVNARLSDRLHPMKLWAASDARELLRNPESAIRTRDVFTAGYFKVQMEYDTRYVIADIALARDLLDMKGRVTSYDIVLDDFDQATRVSAALQEKLGDQYQVQTWYAQHEALFNVMKNEKLVAYLILTLMLLIAAVNIIGGLSMIIVEKTRDIAILKSMGARKGAIRKIFLVESLLVGGIGGSAGMMVAFIVGYIQEHYGLVRINGGESFQEVEFFPLKMWAGDFVLIFLTVFALSVLAGLYPSAKAAGTNIVKSLRK